jgi:hypothetical protein
MHLDFSSPLLMTFPLLAAHVYTHTHILLFGCTYLYYSLSMCDYALPSFFLSESIYSAALNCMLSLFNVSYVPIP